MSDDKPDSLALRCTVPKRALVYSAHNSVLPSIQARYWGERSFQLAFKFLFFRATRAMMSFSEKLVEGVAYALGFFIALIIIVIFFAFVGFISTVR